MRVDHDILPIGAGLGADLPPGVAPAAPTVAQLFDPGSVGERRLDRAVDEIIARLLARGIVSSPVPYDELARERPFAAVPEHPVDPAGYLAGLDRDVLEHSVNTASPAFMGHMTAALPHFVRPLARLVVALNQNPVKVETSKALTVLEREALAMLHHQLYGLGAEHQRAHAQHEGSTMGVITSGGTTANLTALWIARNAAYGPRPGFDGVEREGLGAALVHHGDRRAVVVASRLAHYSLNKAADLLGLGERGLSLVATDAQGRVDPLELRRVVQEHRRRGERVLAIVGVAGTTESGSVDPLDALADVAAEAGAHFHVDAAWGGPLVFSRRHRRLLRGIERADSITIDGHKQLYLPMGIGALVLRDPTRAAVIEKQARYIIRAGSPDLGRRSVEGSRASVAVLLHAALHLLGRAGYAELIDAGIARAHDLARAVRARSAFELVVEPTTNIVDYRYLPPELRARARSRTLSADDERALDALNERLQALQWQRGRSFVSRTTLSYLPRSRSVVVLRAVLANPLTTAAHIEAMLDEQEALAAELLRAPAPTRAREVQP